MREGAHDEMLCGGQTPTPTPTPTDTVVRRHSGLIELALDIRIINLDVVLYRTYRTVPYLCEGRSGRESQRT